MHIKMAGFGLDTMGGAIDIYQLDLQSYMFLSLVKGQQPSCISFAADDTSNPQLELLNPNDIVKDITGQELVARGETDSGGFRRQ